MLHVVTTILFLGSGMFAITVIAAMLIDNAPAIAGALRLQPAGPAPLPPHLARVRVMRNPRLAPMSCVPLRAAA